MKKCPYCAEDIQDEAIKCKHCGEFLDGSGPSRAAARIARPWYFGVTAIVLSLMTVGPLALPLVWVHPQLKPIWKILISVLVLVATWYAIQAVLAFLKSFDEAVKMLEFK